jgi:probable HAF family extracellular repeat protein
VAIHYETMSNSHFAWLATIGLSAALAFPVLAQKYDVTDLGTLGGSSSGAYGINASGQITGYGGLKTGSQAFLYQNGAMSGLGTLGGEYSQGQSINSLGAVAGYSTLSSGAYRAFLYSNGQMSSIGTLGGNYSCVCHQ